MWSIRSQPPQSRIVSCSSPSTTPSSSRRFSGSMDDDFQWPLPRHGRRRPPDARDESEKGGETGGSRHDCRHVASPVLSVRQEEALLRRLLREDDDDDDSESAEETIFYVQHVVLPESDTFDGICLRYRITPVQLRRANGGFSGTNLRLAPAVLRIPVTLSERDSLHWRDNDDDHLDDAAAAAAADDDDDDRRMTTPTTTTTTTTTVQRDRNDDAMKKDGGHHCSHAMGTRITPQDTTTPAYKMQILRNQFPSLDASQTQAWLDAHQGDLSAARTLLLSLCGATDDGTSEAVVT